MKRAIITVVSGSLGLAYCLLVTALANRLQVTPQFPAFAGEDDFTLRTGVFFLFVCPAFIALGITIGFRFHDQLRQILMSSLWTVIATVLYFGVTSLLRPWIEHLAHRSTSNFAAVAYITSWPILGALAAFVGTHRAGSQSNHAQSQHPTS